MIENLFGIQIFELTAGEAPLLTYALLPFPNPLAASGPAQLTLVVSNSTGQFVTVSSIAVTLPVGTTAKTLTASANGIGTVVPDTWTATQNGGIFTLVPKTSDAAKIGPNGLSFIVTGITVNDEPGTCSITITEDASAPGKPRATRSTAIPVAKFPATFHLSDLTVTPPSVTSGGSAVLLWQGSPAVYTLSYDPDGNGAKPHVVGSSGPYTAPNLTAPVVVFTLTAQVTVPGQDQPLVIQRQAVVTVVAGSVSFTALPSIVGVNGVTRLAWTTAGVTSCTLDPGGKSVPVNGYAYAVVKQTTTFTLRATIAGKAPIAAQQTVTVDPKLVGTPYTPPLTGTDGTKGDPGASGGYNGGPGGAGGPGGPTEDRTVTLGPLDPSSTPVVVTSVLFRGGKGGRGGDGGQPMDGGEETGNPGPGGPGGTGGDTKGTLTIVFDASKPPQQLIVTVEPGPAGDGGIGASTPYSGKAPDGKPGNPGTNTATLRFAEVSA
jgi:hypothetical protein